MSDIEAAVTLGLGYPAGPLSWGDRIGGARIVEILTNMFGLTQDPRLSVKPLAEKAGTSGGITVDRRSGKGISHR